MNILGLSIEYCPTGSRAGGKRTIVVGVVALSLMGGGVALANWVASGSGTGAAKAGSSQAVTAPALSVSTATSGLLVPSSSSAVTVSVTNPNAFQVVVSAISVPAATQPASVVGSGCTVTNAKVSIPSNVTSFNLGSGAIPAGQTVSFTSTVSTVVQMAIDSDNACQAASFGFPATVTAAAG